MRTYFQNIYKGLATTFVGMGVTLRNLFRKEVTVQYPDEQLPIPDGYRGLHTLDQDICIYCFQCAKICPVECIDMKAERVEKRYLDWQLFTVDYAKCLFCDLCIEVCPKDCIHMGKQFDFAKYTRAEMVMNLLSYPGMSEKDRKAAEAARKAKPAAAPAPAAAGAAPRPMAPKPVAPAGATQAGAAPKPMAPAAGDGAPKPVAPAAGGAAAPKPMAPAPPKPMPPKPMAPKPPEGA
ncbi:MAG: NADH-quinone oxidoreductase subunit I [Planctomycetota bacterium]